MRLFTASVLFFLFVPILASSQEIIKNAYVCPPCDAHDTLSFKNDGICPVCGMNLIMKTDLAMLNQITIETGSGNFLVEGGAYHKEKSITIFYHKPKNFNNQSPVLLVIPGSGRNGWNYRDAWIEASEKHGILIISPMYSETEYDFGAYHMGNLIYNLNLENSAQYDENSNKVFLDEENFSFEINSNRNKWIYNDFDRIFDGVVKALGSTQTEYDIFGHSAGGQISHRFAIFQPNSKANRILASNSGSYTLPDFNNELPFGIKNTVLSKESIRTSFKKNLILFIGELDNEDEQGGLILRSPSVDKQGIHRLARGKYFYKESKAYAESLKSSFNWQLQIIPDIGHDYKGMSKAAAKYLYENNK